MQTTVVAMPRDSTRTRAVWLLALPFLWFASPTLSTCLAGGVVAMMGVAIRAWAAGTIQKNLRLATVGPYAFVRHPLYLGGLLIGLGLTLAGGHWIWPTTFLLFYARMYSATIGYEEEQLERLFGDDFRAYRARVPRLLPRLLPGPGGVLQGGFKLAQYIRNGEWNVLIGVGVSLGLLAGKMALGL